MLTYLAALALDSSLFDSSPRLALMAQGRWFIFMVPTCFFWIRNGDMFKFGTLVDAGGESGLSAANDLTNKSMAPTAASGTRKEGGLR